MLIRIHSETRPDERRVALVPKTVARLVEAGHRVVLPAGAGAAAGFDDEAYTAAGASVFEGPAPEADLVAAVGPVTIDDVAPTKGVVAFLNPLGEPAEIARFAEAGVVALSMEMIPRTTLAQSMDALSSQATAAGYEAVLLGASMLPRFLPMMMTAAGTIPPARALVLGAGVAGLQAIATVRRLGAKTAGYDIRPEAAEQIESLGATFVGGPLQEQEAGSGGYAAEVAEDVKAQQQASLAKHVSESDLIITTAAVPGRAAPILITTEMVESMKPGSVIIDLAAATGGNCAVTSPGETIVHHGVTVAGPFDLPSRTAGHASEMYSRNVLELVTYLTGDDGALVLDPDDEIASCAVAKDGAVANERVRAALEASS
ncbi:MAG: NAD(P) transhydrogenase subunit alpha [Actinobacteria bacterium]|nr:NAD(P) transhydrogenase subunit alpha [Actinomycetota bacterium]